MITAMGKSVFSTRHDTYLILLRKLLFCRWEGGYRVSTPRKVPAMKLVDCFWSDFWLSGDVMGL